MTDSKPPARRGRPRTRPLPDNVGDDNPYSDAPSSDASANPSPAAASGDAPAAPRKPRSPRRPKAEASADVAPDAPRREPRPEPRVEARSEPQAEVRSEPRPEPQAEPRAEPRPELPSAPPRYELAPDRASGDRPDRSPRPDRYDRAFDRTDSPDRPESVDRAERPPRPEFGDRPDRGPRPDRGDRPERGGRRRDRGRPRNDRGERGPDRGVDRPAPPPRERQEPVAGLDRGDPSLRRNARRGRSRFRREGPAGAVEGGAPIQDRAISAAPVVAEGTMAGWFDPSRDGGYLRQSVNSYLPDPADPFVPPALVRLHQLRRGDKLDVTYGRDQRGRQLIIEVQFLNDGSPVVLEKRPDFNTLTASYPDRKLTLETGRPAKTGPELTRRAIDLIAPIGYGQRALIVAPARAGKTTLLQAIVEGVAINHPQASLLVLLVDERPEEVSEMITWGYGEVVASSFDMPPKRHVEVAEMTLERARRQVEQGKDVVIVLDSITRLARAYNTVERGTGRTMSGGLDSNAMQKPKAFFGSARMIAEQHGGGSLTIISTALVETGSRMDDVIFEEFKGTGNCEIKLDRSLADRRIFPAFDIATSGTRREEKLYRPDQLEKVHLLRRGLHQLPPQAGMEWLIKRIAGTTNNDSLLDGL